MYIYIYTVFHLKKILVRPCSSLFDILVQPCSTPCSTIACSTLFDPLFDPLFDILVRSLFDNLVRNRLFLYEHPFLHPCSTLVRPLVRRPCSTLFDRLFDVLVQSRPGPAKSEHSVAEVPCSIACSSGIVLQRYFVHRLFGFFLDRIFIR